MDYIWVVILIILGLAMLIKPEMLWKIEHFFTVKDGEPTELYLIFMRMGGLFFTVAAIVCFIFSLLD